MQRLPNDIRSLIQKHHSNSPSCTGCHRPCCYESGFATFRNVECIYQKYVGGQLHREDFNFTQGLDFSEFALTYFDIVFNGTELAMLFPKHLSKDNQIVSVPGTNEYWNFRHRFFQQNPWLNYGCIFLKRKIPNSGYTDSIECILHEEDIDDILSAKPIDCVFLTCGPGQNVKHDNQIEAEYFRLLSIHYKDEIELCNRQIYKIAF